VQTRLYKSLKLWSFYADLQESIGTVESTKAVYDRIIELRIATPQIIINYALFLEENNYFEESFKVRSAASRRRTTPRAVFTRCPERRAFLGARRQVYERGVDVFKFPVAFEIWNTYLTKFIKRYVRRRAARPAAGRGPLTALVLAARSWRFQQGGKKLERARDLFEQALASCPEDLAKPLYLMYAKLEEDFGLAKNAMRVYDRATRGVAPEERYEMFLLYISKVAETYGVTHTREIYERAIESLPDDTAREMSLRYADLERKLGEIDRARAILAHGSQFCDPRVRGGGGRRRHGPRLPRGAHAEDYGAVCCRARGRRHADATQVLASLARL